MNKFDKKQSNFQQYEPFLKLARYHNFKQFT